MAQTQNMGRYYPPDMDPRRETLNQRAGKPHALGKRARKIDDGILVVRFELPFNIWCGGCDGHIGQGVRYNAEKRKVGNYLSTPIWSFRCKTACCQNWFEIQTDPKNTRYVIVSGARQQNQEWDPAEHGGHAIQDDGTGGPSSLAASSGGGATPNAFEALEKATAARAAVSHQTARILELEAASSSAWSDPYAANAALRSSFRRGRRERLVEAEAERRFKEDLGWGSAMKLVGESREDAADARRQWREERERRAGVGGVVAGASTPARRARGLTAAPSSSPRVSGEGRASDKRRKRSSLSSSPAAAAASSSPSLGLSARSSKGTTASAAALALAQRLRANTRRRQDPFESELRSATARARR